jgi:hypothetical protein
MSAKRAMEVTRHSAGTAWLGRTVLVSAEMIGISALCLSAWLAIEYSGQHILEAYSFRQTQTALTSFWLSRTGFQFAYETPVAGFPWSIPLEFPLYQYLVAKLSSVFGFDLERAGRLVSYAFLVACLVPVAQIFKNLLPSSWRLHFWLFTGLFLTSPLYLFWGRAFLIETTALFFALCFLSTSIYVLQGYFRWRHALLTGLFLLLAMLQKFTTVLPILLIVIALFALGPLRRREIRFRPEVVWKLVVAFVIPVAVGYGWVIYTDQVRLHNPLGAYLQPGTLWRFYLGTLKARLSKELWIWAVWQRVVVTNVSGVLGCGALLLGVLVLPRRIGAMILLSLGTFLSYFLIFENVHFVHTFYQVANGVFLIAAVSTATAGMIDRFPKYSFPLLAFYIVLLYGNLSSFFAGPYHYHNNAQISSPISGASPERWSTEIAQFDDTNNLTIAVSKLILRNTSEDKPILVYGYEWASDISFFSRRRSFTVPTFFPQYAKVIEDPVRYLGQPPSAIVLCGADTSAQLAPKVDKFFRPFSKATVQDCDIYLKYQTK